MKTRSELVVIHGDWPTCDSQLASRKHCVTLEASEQRVRCDVHKLRVCAARSVCTYSLTIYKYSIERFTAFMFINNNPSLSLFAAAPLTLSLRYSRAALLPVMSVCLL